LSKIVGFTASAFDLGPHAGHVAMLKEAKENCDYLIVALHVNPSVERAQKNAPLPSLSQRFITLKANRFVDEIIPYETESELADLIRLIWPDVRFIGEDYEIKDFTGKDIGIPIHYCKRRHEISSSGLRAKIKG
jgi:glycerol-3-phosphate cytidylyltransferase